MTKQNVAKSAAKKAAGNGFRQSRLSASSASQMPALDWIHIIFLFYSGAHNAINAWHRAEHGLFFVFVMVGILSVELMLWSIYKYWKEGQLIGKMERIGLRAGGFAFLYATLGILAQAQSGGGFLEFYYAWILPSSAPAMFLFAFLIQAANPVDKAERDQKAYASLVAVDLKRDALDRKRMALDQKRQERALEINAFHQRMAAKWREVGSGRVRRALRDAARSDIPRLLAAMGVDLDDDNQKGILARWRYSSPEASKGEVKKLAQVAKKDAARKNGTANGTASLMQGRG